MQRQEFYDLRSFGKMIGKDTRAVEQMVFRGTIPSIKIGEKLYVPASYIDGLFKQSEEKMAELKARNKDKDNEEHPMMPDGLFEEDK